MSDPELEGEVIWIAASNEPSLIDSALKRAGRFDLTIPFLRPDGDARRDILSIQFQERGAQIDLDEAQWEHVLSETEGYTGAELEGVAKGAIWNRLVDGVTDEPVDIPFELVERALSEYQPPVNREQYQQMEDEALLETTAVDILSPAQRKRREHLIEELH